MKASVFGDTSEQTRGTQRPLAHSRGPAIRVVAFGGGTGLANLLKGLKRYVRAPNRMGAFARVIDNLCAVVAVTDDGGSSGRLRKELNMLPPGDIRNCIAALSEDHGLLPRLFQHRFRSGTGLDGHSFGNLFLTALTSITGDFAEAVRQCSEILAISGHVYPATNSDVQVEAIMSDGNRVRGETHITASTGRIVEIQLVPAEARALPQTIEAIACADLITIGPGSLFTSLVPNLLVEGIPEALATSRASRVLICNLMTQANESIGLTASDHVRVLHRHARVEFIDYVMLNTKPASPELKARYAQQGCSQINADFEAREAFGLKVILGDYLEEVDGIARHDTERVASDLLRLAKRGFRRQQRGCAPPGGSS